MRPDKDFLRKTMPDCFGKKSGNDFRLLRSLRGATF